MPPKTLYGQIKVSAIKDKASFLKTQWPLIKLPPTLICVTSLNYSTMYTPTSRVHGHNIYFILLLLLSFIYHFYITAYLIIFQIHDLEHGLQGYEDQEKVDCVNLMFVSGRRLYFPALLNIRKNPLDLILLYKACALDYYN